MGTQEVRAPGGYLCIKGYSDNGHYLGETWSRNEQRDRGEDLPAVIYADPETGIITEQQWFRAGELHRINSPAIIKYDRETGQPVEEAWLVAGTYHRPDGPALIKRDRMTGVVTFEQWTIDGMAHRDDAPAVSYYDAAGELLGEEWWQRGTLVKEERRRPYFKHYPNAPWSHARFNIING